MCIVRVTVVTEKIHNHVALSPVGHIKVHILCGLSISDLSQFKEGHLFILLVQLRSSVDHPAI